MKKAPLKNRTSIRYKTKREFDNLIKELKKYDEFTEFPDYDEDRYYLDINENRFLLLDHCAYTVNRLSYKEAMKMLSKNRDLYSLEVGDVVLDSSGRERTVLGVIESTQEAGLLVFLTNDFLSSLYSKVVTSKELEEHGYKLKGEEETVEVIFDGKKINISKESAEAFKKQFNK